VKITIQAGKSGATMHDCIYALNKKVPHEGFFGQGNDGITFPANSNQEIYTRLICLLGLFLCFHPKVGFLALGLSDIKGTVAGYFYIHDWAAFYNFINQIGNIRDLKLDVCA